MCLLHPSYLPVQPKIACFNFGTVPKSECIVQFADLKLGPGVSYYCEMSRSGGFFVDYYKTVAENLTREGFENFKNASSDFDKIRILYPYCEDMTIGARRYGKDDMEALRAKNDGNSYFAKHVDYKALQCYNAGIIKCPDEPIGSRQLLAVLVANRSACLFEMGKYKETLDDINYVLFLDAYPEELKYKLYLRQAKCYTNNEATKYKASKAYEMAMQCLNQSKLNPTAMKEKKSEIARVLEEVRKYEEPADVKLEHKLRPFISGAYKDASEAVRFDRNETLGCFAVAHQNIEAGTIIIDEPAYCAVISEDFTLTNCQHCMLATDIPVACAHCANVVYCSLKCKELAFTYHQRECGLHPVLFTTGASINCCMALRIITQYNLAQFEEISNEDSSHKRFIDDKLCGVSHHYHGVYRLCRNEEKRSNEEYVQYTIMAIFLLKLLKTTNFFNSTEPLAQCSDVLTTTEIFIGSLLLRHLQALQFNAHEISELREAPPGPLDPQDEPNFKTIYVGGGLFTTLAMFNHSCDPSIVRYNVGSNMVVKTIKPINEGDMIYENYGPIYTNAPREERQKFLSERYWFTCNCQPCIENWPEFKNMTDSEVEIPCNNRKCNNTFYLHKIIDNPSIKCQKCGKFTNLFLHLKVLSTLEDILPRAEELYKNKKYDEAITLYLTAIHIYAKNTVPPFPDWVKVQQRLRTCIVSEGNKSIEYIRIRGSK